jgi:hypothetical protein
MGTATLAGGNRENRGSGAAELETAPLLVRATTQVGTTYTLALGDAGTLVEFSAATGVTVTVPPNSGAAFAIGTTITLRQYGAGQVAVAAGAGVTIRSLAGALGLGGRYAQATLTKRATNEWVLSGSLTILGS